MIKIDKLFASYNKKIATSNISLDIDKGSVTTIIGPNGCGKSTLLKCISRNLPTDCGEITILGKNLNRYKTKELAKIMALLPQNSSAPVDFTVSDLVSFGRYPFVKLGGGLKQEDLEVIDWALEKTDMLNFKTRRISNLSGGERQRAWVAMALAQKPQIMLLDEPTTFLDLSHQFEVLELIKDINRNTGMTIIMVLHDVNQAAKYSDNIVVMDSGKIQCYGKPEETITKKTMENVFKLQGNFIKNGKYSHFIPGKSLRSSQC